MRAARASRPKIGLFTRQRSVSSVLDLGAVLALVVRAVVPGADRIPPRGVVAIPGDGLLEALGEVRPRLPAERADLLRAQRVAAVVSGPVGDVLKQIRRGAGQLDDPLHDLDVRALVGAADVVGLAGRP